MVHLVWILGWIEFHLAPFWCSTIFISCSAIFRVCTVSLSGKNSVTGEISKFSSAQAKLGKQWNTQHSNQPNIVQEQMGHFSELHITLTPLTYTYFPQNIEGACRWRLGSSAVLGPQLSQSARTDKGEVRKRIQAAFEEQKHSVRNRREGRMAVAQGNLSNFVSWHDGGLFTAHLYFQISTDTLCQEGIS